MSGKRKKVTVTIEKKLEALFRIDKGEPMKSVAVDLGVGTSTVSDWKKNRKEIEEFCAKMVSRDSLGNRGTIKKAKNVTLMHSMYGIFKNVKMVYQCQDLFLEKKLLVLIKS